MNMRVIALLCAVGILPLVQGCGTNTVMPVTIVLGMQDSGTSVNANAADRFVIVLPATGGSGYAWEVVNGDPAVVRLEQTKEVVVSSLGVAGQGFESLVFLAAGKGTTTLNLEYRLVGAPSGTAAISTFSVTITNEV